MIHRSALPKGVNPMVLGKRVRMNTLAGSYESGVEVMLKGLHLPEFDKSRNIEEQKALVFGANCRYDLILGNDFINKVGISRHQGVQQNGSMAWKPNSNTRTPNT